MRIAEVHAILKNELFPDHGICFVTFRDYIVIFGDKEGGGLRMTIQECYQKLGGDFEKVKTRLPSVSLITKFITKFLDDSSFSELCRALEEGQREEDFRAAHTLKGVYANLGFDQLENSASALTELLRPKDIGIPEEAVSMMNEVKRDYEITVGAIRAYLEPGNHAE